MDRNVNAVEATNQPSAVVSTDPSPRAVLRMREYDLRSALNRVARSSSSNNQAKGSSSAKNRFAEYELRSAMNRAAGSSSTKRYTHPQPDKAEIPSDEEASLGPLARGGSSRSLVSLPSKIEIERRKASDSPSTATPPTIMTNNMLSDSSGNSGSKKTRSSSRIFEMSRPVFAAVLGSAMLAILVAAIWGWATIPGLRDQIDELEAEVDRLELQSGQTLLNSFEALVDLWDGSFFEVYRDEPWIDDRASSIGAPAIGPVMAFVDEELLTQLCLDVTNFEEFLVEAYCALEDISADQLIQGVSLYSNLALDYMFPDECELGGVTDDEWAAASYECENLERPYRWG